MMRASAKRYICFHCFPSREKPLHIGPQTRVGYVTYHLGTGKLGFCMNGRVLRLSPVDQKINAGCSFYFYKYR